MNLEKSVCGAGSAVEARAPSRSTAHAAATAASESNGRARGARVTSFDGFDGSCSSGSRVKVIAVHFFVAALTAEACDAGTGRRPFVMWHLTHTNSGFAAFFAMAVLSMPSGVGSM